MYSVFQGWAEYKCWCLHHQTMYLQDSATELELRVLILSGTEEQSPGWCGTWNMDNVSTREGEERSYISRYLQLSPSDPGQWWAVNRGSGRMMIGSVGVAA